MKRLLFDELPKALNQVQIGGIGRQKEQLNLEGKGQVDDKPTMLIACIIQHEGKRFLREACAQELEQANHTVRVNVGIIGHGEDFQGERV